MIHIYFDVDRELKEKTRLDIDPKVRALFELEDLGLYSVILHNDPINEVDFVVDIIRRVFGYSLSKAIWLMLKAHFSGKSILWSGSKSDATKKMKQMISFGPDPKVLHKGAKPLTVTIENNG
jgi:ATP-dependent Clp protease adaptor protein ClpS